MMKPFVPSFIVGALLAALAVGHAFGESLPDWVVKNGPAWQPPADGVVRDQATAITIAHAAWVSMHPEMSDQIGPEEVWRPALQATLRDGVWEVTGKSDGRPTVGGGLFIYISRSDGRIMSIVLTQ